MLLNEYGIHPWQMDRWTGRELAALMAHHRQKQLEQEAG